MNTFGQSFRISIFGESHGELVGVVVDGCPAGIMLAQSDFMHDLNRRRSGAKGTTARKEADQPRIISGIYKGLSTGAPIAILFDNNDVRSDDYDLFQNIPRPGHADFSAAGKWRGFNDPRGGGHLSGRLTIALVAAGVIAKKIIAPIVIQADITEAGGKADIDSAVETAKIVNDSIGGIIRCTAKNVPVGWGEPFFNSAESLISHLIFSIPGINAIAFGVGFGAARMNGSDHNDAFISPDGETATNNTGGINGGITNGNELFFQVSVKPASGISKPQNTLNFVDNSMTKLVIRGRHDTCFAIRLPVVIEAATAIALADMKQCSLTD